jgi:hypothetical protein
MEAEARGAIRFDKIQSMILSSEWKFVQSQAVLLLRVELSVPCGDPAGTSPRNGLG